MTKTPTKTSPDQSLVAGSSSGLKLEFVTEDKPEAGEVREIADGVFWLRFALPMTGLNHINLWALRDGDGWVVVDTGIGNRDSKEIWKKHFKELMGGRPVNRVICTHLHPDHTGLAGWICREFGAPLLMTRGEYFLCRLMAADTGRAAPPESLKLNFTNNALAGLVKRLPNYRKAMTAWLMES